MGIDKTVLRAGNGAKPSNGARCTVHCTGYRVDAQGKRSKFWSTRDDNEPFTFKVGLGHVIRGWDQGVLRMRAGELAELLLSPDFAYGSRGFPAWGIGPNETLLFEIELLSVEQGHQERLV